MFKKTALFWNDGFPNQPARVWTSSSSKIRLPACLHQSLVGYRLCITDSNSRFNTQNNGHEKTFRISQNVDMCYNILVTITTLWYMRWMAQKHGSEPIFWLQLLRQMLIREVGVPTTIEVAPVINWRGCAGAGDPTSLQHWYSSNWNTHNLSCNRRLGWKEIDLWCMKNIKHWRGSSWHKQIYECIYKCFMCW